MQTEAITDGGHAVLTYTKMKISFSEIARLDITTTLYSAAVAAGQIGAAAQ